MVLCDKVDTDCTTFDDPLTSGDLDIGHRITKIVICTPWHTTYHLCNFGGYVLVSFGGVRWQTDKHTYMQTNGLTLFA